MNTTALSDKGTFEAATGVVADLSFRDVDLRGVEAPENATFRTCDFSGADLSGVTLAGLTFDACQFRQTNLRGAVLLGSHFTNACDLERAILDRADARNATFTGATMDHVRAHGAEFEEADFTGATLNRAEFDRANLSDATGFTPDQTGVDRAVFSGSKLDIWTKLRFEYTGLKLGLALLPPIIFLLSLLIEAYASLAISAYAVQTDPLATCGPDSERCETVQVWQIVLGVREGGLAVTFVIFSIAYNIARLALTLKVSQLAQSEDRSRKTPALAGWLGLRSLNRVARGIAIAKWVMLGLFVINMFNLAMHEIKIPKDDTEQAEG